MRTQHFTGNPCAHKIKISLHTAGCLKMLLNDCVWRRRRKQMEYAGGCYAYNNHTMFFSRRVMLVVVEREVYPCCRIRGKFETISTNRETDGRTDMGYYKRPIHLFPFLSLTLVAVEYQFVCAVEWTTDCNSCVCCPCLVFFFFFSLPRPTLWFGRIG